MGGRKKGGVSASTAKRNLAKVFERNVHHRTVPHRTTTTRHHITSAGHAITEVPRHISRAANTNVDIVDLLELPPEEATTDGLDPSFGDPNGKPHDPEELEKDKTQTRHVLDGFTPLLSRLEECMFMHYSNPVENEDCRCGKGRRHVSCWDCSIDYPTSCAACFIASHRYNTDHWARVWDPITRFYTKVDYTAVLPEDEDVSIQLGHPQGDAPCSLGEKSHSFTIVHQNGIHSTRIRFCQCRGAGDRAIQLAQAKLFPASAAQPQTAFSFTVLKQFQSYNLQCKTTAFDFIMTLRRMTDNIRPHMVPDPYKAFSRITRVWDYLTMNIHVGRASGINALLPFRPANSIITYCPACPEPGVNMPEGWENAPSELKHINTLFKIMDGNHRANRYSKNTDPTDVSHWDGITISGYFPDKKAYQAYLAGIPITKEKSVCNFINAVNAQDRKKFRGNDETGIIVVMCPHGFVDSAVDMFLGERFAYSDYALAHALTFRDTKGIDVALAYDSSCSYSVNILDRFKSHLPQHTDVIARIRFLIDSLHVHDHIDKCMYLFSTSYIDNMGHFHGTAVEQYWSEHNGLGPQTSQMNPGHRHEVITAHHSYWNWKKTTRISSHLVDALTNSRRLYITKRDYFRDLSKVHWEKIPKWYAMDRQPVVDNGEVRSVYRHTTSKALSFEAVYQRLVRMNARPSADPSNAQIIYFLAEGISIQTEQLSIKLLVRMQQTHPLASTKQEIKKKREDLHSRLEKWRDLQALHMSSAKTRVLSQIPLPVEEEVLYLPSGIPPDERTNLNSSLLVEEESKLRLALVHECILQLRLTVKMITILHRQRRRHMRGQKQNTRARSRIHSSEIIRDRLLLIYNTSRESLVALGKLDPTEERLPSLSLADLVRKSTMDVRQINDTHRSEGRIWTIDSARINSNQRSASIPISNPSTSRHIAMQVDEEPAGVNATTAGTASGENGDSDSHDSGREEQTTASASKGGKLWDPLIGFSDRELEEWEQEEDRVQWHRAWAEMLRWLEEFELKQVECVRSINSFETLMSTWEALAAKECRPGYATFARRQAHIYRRLHQDLLEMFTKKAEPRFVDPERGIISAILAFRRQELEWLVKMAGTTA